MVEGGASFRSPASAGWFGERALTQMVQPSGLIWQIGVEPVMHAGSGSFMFQVDGAITRNPLTVFYYCPRGHTPHDPVVMLLHGSDRAASYFRDCWIEHAEAMQALVVVPCFDEKGFPGPASYNYGNVLAGEEPFDVRPQSEWSYGLLDRVFLHVRTSMRLHRTRYHLFGHSAGAQFAHRCLALLDPPCVDLAVLGGSGWYMLPDNDLPFPSGLGGVGLDSGHVRRYLQRNNVILLGGRDDDPNAAGLPREPAAVAQGSTRLARGEFYFRYCKDLAERLGVAFGWSLSYAPGIGHDDDQIALPAAVLIKAHLTNP